MSDTNEARQPIYISYSHADQEFVSQLTKELEKQKRQSLGHWDNTYPTSYQWRQLYTLMEKAEAVLFIISPDSIDDERWKQEIFVAREKQKRLLPIYYRTLTPEQETALRLELGENNTWIQFRDVPNIAQSDYAAFINLISILHDPNPPFFDLFISYSSKDVLFVRRLYLAFDAIGKEVWVDWEELPPGTDFPERIKRGVEKSNFFVCVLSPEFHASEYCNMEISHARIHNKPLIPVSRRKITGENLQSAIKTRNWREDILPLAVIEENRRALEHIKWITEAQSDATFDAAFLKLRTVLEKDVEYIDQLRDLLNQALDWQRDQSSDRLLRRRQLHDAESWLLVGATKQPQPTPLHTRFIEASRLAYENRRRLILLGSIAVSLLLMVLLIFAIYQADRAHKNANTARRNERTAIRERNRADEQTFQANNQLQTLVLANTTITQSVGPNPKPPLLLGTDLWVATGSGQIWQLRADTGQPRGAPVEIMGADLYRPVYDGKYLWVGSVTGDKLTRIDPGNIQTAATIDVDSSSYPPIVTGGAWVWVLTQRQLVPVNRETLEVGKAIAVGRDPKYPLFDGTYIWVVDNQKGELYRIHYETGAAQSITLGHYPQQPAFAAGCLWITTAEGGQLLQIDPGTLTVLKTIPIGQNVTTPTLAGDWLWLAASVGEGPDSQNQIIQIDPQSGAIIKQIPISTPARAFYVHDHSLWVYENGSDIYTINLDTYEREITIPNVNARRLSEPVFTPDDVWIADNAGNRIYVIALKDGRIVRQLPQCAGPTPPIFDGTNMWTACTSQQKVARIPALLDFHGQSSGIDQSSENSRSYPPILIDQLLWIVQEADGKVIAYNTALQDVRPAASAFEVGAYPSRIAQDSSSLWLTNDEQGQGLLYRFDGDKISPPDVFTLGPDWPGPVEVINGKLWFFTITDRVNPVDNDLLIVDPATGTVQEQINIGLFLTGFVQDDDIVWVNVANVDGGTLCRLDASTGANLGCATLEHIPASEPVIIGDSVWVSGAIPGGLFSGVLEGVFSTENAQKTPSISGALYEFRRSDGQLIRKIDVEHSPWLPVAAGPYLWFTQTARLPILNTSYNNINEYILGALDPETGKVVKEWNPCQNMLPPFYDGTFLYAACIGTQDDPGDLLVIDPVTLAEVHTYADLGQGAWPLTRIGDWVWVTYRDTNNAAVLRAGTGELVHLYGLGQAPTPPVYDGSLYFWIANTVDATVQRILLPEE